MHQRIEQLLKRRDLTKLTSGRSYRLKTEVPLYSPDAPFHGICDAVLELEDGTYIPLEIKSGNASPHTGEIIQLCAYAVLLEQLHGGRERQKFCVHGIIGARQTGASNEHEHQTQFS